MIEESKVGAILYEFFEKNMDKLRGHPPLDLVRFEDREPVKKKKYFFTPDPEPLTDLERKRLQWAAIPLSDCQVLHTEETTEGKASRTQLDSLADFLNGGNMFGGNSHNK